MVYLQKKCEVQEISDKYETTNIPKFDESYTIRGGITNQKKAEMKEILKKSGIALIE